MTKFIVLFVLACIGLELLAWATNSLPPAPEWILWAAIMVALRVSYLAGKADGGRHHG